MASYRGRRRGPAAVPPAASTPVAAVTPTLAVSSGLLNDVTESEDEMESLAQSQPVAPGRTTFMATVSRSSEVGLSAASGAQPSVDLIKLQCQVQQLTEIVQSRLSTDNDDLSAQQGELEAENARLHETIAMADKQLTDLRLQTSQMEHDFSQELNSLKDQLKEAQELVGEESRQNNLLKRNLERALRSKSGLESYINDLPSKDEVEVLKVKLAQKSERNERLESKIEALEGAHQGNSRLNHSLQKQCKNLEEEVNELKLQLNEAETLNRGHTDRLARAAQAAASAGATTPGSSAAGRLEVLMEQRDTLEAENAKLKKYIVFQKAKSEKRTGELTSELSTSSDRCLEAEKRLEALGEEVEALKGLVSMKRDQVGEKDECIRQLRRRVAVLEDHLASSKTSQSVHADVGQIKGLITGKLRRCVKDFQSLTKVSKQILQGEDPNVSMLLGVESRDASDDDEDESQSSECRELEKLQADLKKLQSTHADIGDLRQLLTDKYAESFADNCKMQ